MPHVATLTRFDSKHLIGTFERNIRADDMPHLASNGRGALDLASNCRGALDLASNGRGALCLASNGRGGAV